jgi:protein-S-isoprenylcysteine O-methyltransferase Ste14
VAVGWQALIVASFAGLVGLAELVSRYRSDPKYLLRHSTAAWLYVLLNVGAGVGALFIIRAFGWTFGDSAHVDLWRILVAGFGAIAFFRRFALRDEDRRLHRGCGTESGFGQLA